MRKKPTKEQFNSFFKELGEQLCSSFDVIRFRHKAFYKFYDRTGFETETILSCMENYLNYPLLSFEFSSNRILFKVELLKQHRSARTVYANFAISNPRVYALKEAAELADEEAAKICPPEQKNVAPKDEVSTVLAHAGLPAIQAVDYDDLRKKAGYVLSDASFLRTKVIEALKNDFNLNGISKDIAELGSVWKTLTNVSKFFSTGSLVPLIYAVYTGVSTFVSKSSNSPLPYLAGSLALLCLSGATILGRNLYERSTSESIRNNITTTFQNQTAIDKLFDNIEQLQR